MTSGIKYIQTHLPTHIIEIAWLKSELKRNKSPSKLHFLGIESKGLKKCT